MKIVWLICILLVCLCFYINPTLGCWVLGGIIASGIWAYGK